MISSMLVLVLVLVLMLVLVVVLVLVSKEYRVESNEYGGKSTE